MLVIGQNPKEIIAQLMYSSYRFNRLHAPGIKPERWAAIYPNAEALENAFQTEKAIESLSGYGGQKA
jgi:hypothetical protein